MSTANSLTSEQVAWKPNVNPWLIGVVVSHASQETGSAATVAEIRLSRLRFASCWLTWVERWV